MDFLCLQGQVVAEISTVFPEVSTVSTQVKTGTKGNWSDWLRRVEDLGLVEEYPELYGSGKEKTEVKANSVLSKVNHISDEKVYRSAVAYMKFWR